MKGASVGCHCWLNAKLTVNIVDGIRLLRASTVCVFFANPLDRSRDTSHCHPLFKNAAENVSIRLQIAHKYLVEKNLSPADETQFKEQLYRIWFELYTRRGSSRWVESGTARKI